ncbi:MAG: response regulator [Magnetococcales bacterium]|nr:response regulator [Magnetococcales bacterium]
MSSPTTKDPILVVEDSSSFAALLKSRIEAALPVEAVMAASLAQARERIQERSGAFSMSLLDLNLPDAPDGEVVDEILAARIPAIVLTGLYRKDLQDRMLGKGVLDYFVKDGAGVIEAVIHAVDRIRRNQRLQVMVVDDSSSARRLLGGFLARFGFRVLEAKNGREAMERLEANRVHLVISDYEMPEMDGLAFMRRLRARHSRDDVAAIGLSSVGESDLAVRFIKAGANDFLVKPYKPEELLCRVYQNIEHTERHQALQSILTRHRSVLENALDAIITTDGQGRVLDYNPAAEILFGYRREQVMGRPVADFVVPPELRSRHEAGLASHRGRSEPLNLARRLEIQAVRADGMRVDLQVALIGLTQGEEDRFTAFLQDITDRKQLLKSLEETLGAAEAANRAKSDFIANMSHEIRTPMNAVLGFTDLALKGEVPPRLLDYLGKIKNASHSLMGIINDILDFSKMDAQRLTLDPVKFSLHHMLERIADLFSQQVAEKGIELVLQAPADFHDVLLGDVMRLEQVLINLIRNAVKFTEKGTVVVRARPLVGDQDQLRLEFEVRDTGIGIDPKILPGLFAPFVQADTSTTRKYGGTGLGLSISKRLVELMDGRIDAESQPGVGSRFHFHVAMARHGDNRRRVAAVPPGMQGERVLMVTGNVWLGEWLHELTRAVGLVPTLAAEAREAIAVLLRANGGGEEPFRHLLVDANLPGPGGAALAVELGATLQAEAPRAVTPRIVLMAPFGQDPRKGASGAGDALLEKPVTRPRLIRALVENWSADTTGIDRRSERILASEEETGIRVGGGRVLLAENNAVSRQVGRELLERVGLVVETAGDGLQAVAMVARHPFDLVLMDLQMPGLDGLAATRRIREGGGRQGTTLPIIALTAHGPPEEIQRCLATGMNGHLTKPVRPERLYGMLAKWIPETRLRRNPELPPEKPDAGEGPDIAGIDLRAGLERVGGNRKLHGRLLVRFLEEQETVAEQVTRDLGEGRRSEAAVRLHVLKGAAASLGAVGLCQAVEALEKVLEGPPEAWRSALAVLVNKAERLMARLRDRFPGPTQPGPAEVGRPGLDLALDRDQVAEHLETLAVHMAFQSLEVEPALSRLGDLMGEGPGAAVFRQLTRLIEDFHFPEALELLRRMAGSAGLDLAAEFRVPPAARRERILIVDDQPTNVALLKEVLADFDRCAALNGPQALALLAAGLAPDLILLDIMMPEMNGYEVCRRMKQAEGIQGIPVIFVTARKEVSDQAEGFRLGGVDYITKPFDPEIVKRRVINHLELKRHRDRLETLVRERTRELEEARQAAERGRQAAEAGNRAKSEFLATVSHEIRTPLNSIMGTSQLLLETTVSPEQRQYLEIAHKASEALLVLVNDTLDLSKIEAGQMVLEKRPFQLHDVFKSALEIQGIAARGKKIGLSLERGPDLPERVIGDPDRLLQVLMNLLNNAIKFTHFGEVTMTVSRGERGRIVFQVRDTGIGIPADKLQQIFLPFNQADASTTRRYGGTGLGLTICRRLVEAMGGTITVESRVGEGSTFEIRLPLPPVADPARQAEPSAPETGTTPTAVSRILLADDSEDNRALFNAYLKGCASRLVMVENGAQAVSAFQSDLFDLVFMDMLMPVQDGFSATREIRAWEREQGRFPTPIVALTALSVKEDLELALQAGCDSYLIKPVRKERFLDTIRTYCGGDE